MIPTDVHFRSPWALAGLVLLAPVIFLNLRRRGGVGVLSVFLQCLAVALVVAALSDVRVRLGEAARMPYLVFQDVSASTRGQEKLTALNRNMDWPVDAPVEVYDFAASATRAAGRPDESATNLVPAVQVALARGGGAAGFIFQTDGRFQDKWRPYAEELSGRARDVLILPMTSPPPDARIGELTARRTVGDEVRLRLTVTSNAMQRRGVRVYREDAPDEPLFEKTLNLLMDDAATFRITDRAAPADEAVVYRAELLEADAFERNDAAEIVLPPAARRVAVVGPPRTSVNLPAEIGAAVEKINPAGAPRDAAGWMNFSAVVLFDPRGDLLDRQRRASLGDYVAAGGGLVQVGAGPSAGPGDEADPLNRVAALVANPYRRKKMNVTVVLDASGSMGETAGTSRRKFDRAREAVLALQEYLGPSDSLAVVIFSDRPRVVYRSGAGGVDFSALEQAMGEVAPAGPTDVAPALKLAAKNRPSGQRQGLVIVVSDLRTRPFDPTEVAEMFAPDNLSLAVVAVRSGEDGGGGDLRELADMLDAEMLTSRTLADLAEIFAGFVRKARGGRVREGKFAAELARPAFGINPDQWPPLDAYILAAPRENAEVIVRAADDPILARRVAGMGRSVTLAVPVGAESNEGLVRSGAFGEFLASAVRWAMRGESDSRFTAELEDTGGKLKITVNAEDADGPMNFLDLTAAVSGFDAAGRAHGNDTPRAEPPYRQNLHALPSGRFVETPLAQVGPGRYSGQVNLPGRPAAVEVRDKSGRTVWTGTVARTAGAEYSAVGPDWKNLRRLAELTGGEIIDARQLPRAVRAMRRRDFVPLWPWLLAAAVAVMLADWLIGRMVARRVVE